MFDRIRAAGILATISLLVAAATLSAHAQTANFPNQPIRIIVPFAAGGPTDQAARLIAEEMSKSVGSTIVENRPGAGGTIGAAAVAKSPADGHTLLLNTGAAVIAQHIYANPGYNIISDFSSVGLIARGPLVLFVRPDLPAKTIAEFIAYAKSHPDDLKYGSNGIGSTPHLSGELLNTVAGIKTIHVPYRGIAALLPDLLTGRIDFAMFNLDGGTAQYLKTGQLRALVVAGPQRISALPDLPSVNESNLSGFEMSTWYGLSAPKGTPAAVIERISAALAGLKSNKAANDGFTASGLAAAIGTPAEMEAFVKEESRRNADLIKAARIPQQQ